MTLNVSVQVCHRLSRSASLAHSITLATNRCAVVLASSATERQTRPNQGLPMARTEVGSGRRQVAASATSAGDRDPSGAAGGAAGGDETMLGVLGFGKMSAALVGGFISAGTVKQANVHASVRSHEKQQGLRDKGFVNVYGDALHGGAQEVAAKSDVIFLGVKPQVIRPVLHALAPHLDPERHLVVSIAAGITLSDLEESLGQGVRVVRVMPNTPSLVGSGASAYALGSYANDADCELVRTLLSSVGLAIKVQEKMISGVTGVSGSGPAYVYMAIEAMADGGVKCGLPRETALMLAAQTVKGAADMVLNNGDAMIHPGVLKDDVASPAGATIEAIAELEAAGMRSAFIRAVVASARRSDELS